MVAPSCYAQPDSTKGSRTPQQNSAVADSCSSKPKPGISWPAWPSKIMLILACPVSSGRTASPTTPPMATNMLSSRVGAQVPARQPAVCRRSATKVVCSAQPQPVQAVTKVLGAGLLAAALSLGTVQSAHAEDLFYSGENISGLTKCSENKAYQKRQKNEVKALQKRLKQYEPDSAPATALNATIERTEKRFANYAKANLLCGTDGLPHLISDPGLALRFGHAGETLIPTFAFLYIAGYIGSVGREYLVAVRGEKKPVDKEIIIDVPLALKLAAQGAVWPLRALQQLRNGTLLERDENITVSPR